MFCESYFTANTLDEALTFLQRHVGKARVIAGGTDLVIQLKDSEKMVKTLVYIDRIRELRYIRKDGYVVRIGALSTHDDLASSELIKEEARALALAAKSIGSPQIRRVGTVGGNIVNAQPAADVAIALTALGARVKVVSADGERTHDLRELYLGIGRSAIDPAREILTEVFFTAPGASGFRRLARKETLSLPTLNTAASITIDDEGVCQEVRVAIGPVADVPFRAEKAEAMLRGTRITNERINQAAETAMLCCSPRDSLIRGRAEYRREMVRVLVERVLADCAPGIIK